MKQNSKSPAPKASRQPINLSGKRGVIVLSRCASIGMFFRGSHQQINACTTAAERELPMLMVAAQEHRQICRRQGAEPGRNDSIKRFLSLLVSLWVFSSPAQDVPSASPTLSGEAAPALPTLSESAPILSTNWNMGFTLGAGFGVSAMGSTEAHHLSVATLHVGKLLESERPFLRHVELAGELWSGAQYHPDTAYLVGLTPVVRYHFLPGSRLDPFLDGGAGVTATDIGHPDLSTTFEFNLQVGAGFHWVLHKNVAFTFDARYIHLSNAHIDTPNKGVNSFLFSSGLTWFF